MDLPLGCHKLDKGLAPPLGGDKSGARRRRGPGRQASSQPARQAGEECCLQFMAETLSGEEDSGQAEASIPV